MSDILQILTAFSAGLLSFFSPCVLPLIPAYLCFITGLSLDELRAGNRAVDNLNKIVGQTLLFVLGFSFIFVTLGATASCLGSLISAYKRIIMIVGGSIIILLGLHVSGLFRIKGLEYEKKLYLKSKPANLLGSFVVGIVFAFGWAPCVGPALAAILGLAGTEKTIIRGVILLSAYSLGLGIPFILTALAANRFLNLFNKAKRYLKLISIVSGILLAAIGIWIIIGAL
ncbi:cytochrome c biogenesis protein CcdA [bacterium]|nr:cytochrome c biogenesis protein CcdA [bacterium]